MLLNELHLCEVFSCGNEIAYQFKDENVFAAVILQKFLCNIQLSGNFCPSDLRIHSQATLRIVRNEFSDSINDTGKNYGN